MATKEEILAELNPEQQSAVTDYEGSMVVEAPPGSGKTHTIVSRCQYMILDGVKPGSILVFTFTRKAANELRERIQAAVGEQSAKAMTIATYHSFCGQLLRKFQNYLEEIKTSPFMMKMIKRMYLIQSVNNSIILNMRKQKIISLNLK